jgi:hypothetical protein
LHFAINYTWFCQSFTSLFFCQTRSVLSILNLPYLCYINDARFSHHSLALPIAIKHSRSWQEQQEQQRLQQQCELFQQQMQQQQQQFEQQQQQLPPLPITATASAAVTATTTASAAVTATSSEAEKISALRRELAAARATQQAAADQSMCCVCLSQPKNVAFLPCRHACTCIECCKTICDAGNATCPVCRAPISGFMEVFL